MKQFTVIAFLAALVPAVSAATCSIELISRRGQNPIVGGDNTLQCSATIFYGDGSSVVVNDACNSVVRDACYSSNLPYQVCVHTNTDLSDGYIDYADQHADFNEDGCTKESDAGIAGDSDTTTCSFEC